MKLSPDQPAPDFSVNDVYGQPIDLKKLVGKKVYLAFERNAGCPVCNLRMHEMLAKADRFVENNTVVVMVYESSHSKMKEYLGKGPYPFHFIADPTNELYNHYAVERSMVKIMKGLFHGLLSKAIKGKKLFKDPIKQDGHTDRIHAEFMIDETGKLTMAHYANFIGDHVPLDKILER